MLPRATGIDPQSPGERAAPLGASREAADVAPSRLATPAATSQAARPAHAHNTHELDPRGAAKPDLARQTLAIQELGLSLDLTPDEAAMRSRAPRADVSAPALPGDATTVAEIDAAAGRQRAAIVASSGAQQDQVAAAITSAAPHRVKAGDHKQRVQHHGRQAAHAHRQSLAQAQDHKRITRDQLRAKLTTTAAADRQAVTVQFETRKLELERDVQFELAQLATERQRAIAQVERESEARAVALQGDLARRKTARELQFAADHTALVERDRDEQTAVRTQARASAAQIKAGAQTQAQATQRNAEAQAHRIEAQGDAEAEAALASGEHKARQAITAANKHADDLDDDHKEAARQVRAQGAERAKMAIERARARATELRARAQGDARTLRDKGKVDHDHQLDDGAARAARALESGEQAAASIHARTLGAMAALQSAHDAAERTMQREAEAITAELTAGRSALAAEARGALSGAEARAAIEAELRTTLARITGERDATCKAIDDRVAADLAQIDAAGEQDLARLGQQIDRDLGELDAAVTRTDGQIDEAVARAEQRTGALVAREQAQIRAGTTQLLGQLEHMAAQARQRLAVADRGATAQVHAAGQQGLASVAASAAHAHAELDDATRSLVAETTAQGERDRAAADRIAAESRSAMDSSRSALDHEIDRAWIDDAVQQAHAKLDDQGGARGVSGEDASDAMTILTSLPTEQQGEAIRQLDQAAFDNLLQQVPADRRAELGMLAGSSHDPQRALQLSAGSRAPQSPDSHELADDRAAGDATFHVMADVSGSGGSGGSGCAPDPVLEPQTLWGDVFNNAIYGLTAAFGYDSHRIDAVCGPKDNPFYRDHASNMPGWGNEYGLPFLDPYGLPIDATAQDRATNYVGQDDPTGIWSGVRTRLAALEAGFIGGLPVGPGGTRQGNISQEQVYLAHVIAYPAEQAAARASGRSLNANNPFIDPQSFWLATHAAPLMEHVGINSGPFTGMMIDFFNDPTDTAAAGWLKREGLATAEQTVGAALELMPGTVTMGMQVQSLAQFSEDWNTQSAIDSGMLDEWRRATLLATAVASNAPLEATGLSSSPVIGDLPAGADAVARWVCDTIGL
ncbi:MAG TPA: hypothetical protein VFK02_10015 [Kofleriaceae bacterium]|nr:hypothetical protein [Kofleriaceae bacterium]